MRGGSRVGLVLADISGKGISAALIDAVQRFSGREQEDDITVIVARGR